MNQIAVKSDYSVGRAKRTLEEEEEYQRRIKQLKEANGEE